MIYSFIVHDDLTETIHIGMNDEIEDIRTEIGYALWIVRFYRSDY